MNPKGPSLVDLDTAEVASSRRSLIGAAGLVGAAAALLGASNAAASPNTPTEADLPGLDAARQLELAARDLYLQAAEGLAGDIAELAGVIAANHGAYAQAIAGATGTAATGRNEAIFDSQRSLFTGSDAQAFGSAARSLENIAVATHTELLGSYESSDAIALTASILTTEARHAAVLTSVAGFFGNLDDVLSPQAAALDLSGGAA